MDKVAVVYSKFSYHVLAAATRNANPNAGLRQPILRVPP